MLKIRPLLALGFAACLAALSAPALALAVGDTAPDFELKTNTGTQRLSALRGKLVYLDFWASWCGPCRQSFPWMNELQTKLGPRGLQVLGVNVDAKLADAQKFLGETPARFSVVFDAAGETPRQYAIKGMPTSVLIGPDGRVLMVHNGFRAEARAELEAQIEAALSATLSAQKVKP